MPVKVPVRAQAVLPVVVKVIETSKTLAVPTWVNVPVALQTWLLPVKLILSPVPLAENPNGRRMG